MSGGYTRALIADEGITFMEWLGKESDETQVPEEDEERELVAMGPSDKVHESRIIRFPATMCPHVAGFFVHNYSYEWLCAKGLD